MHIGTESETATFDSWVERGCWANRKMWTRMWVRCGLHQYSLSHIFSFRVMCVWWFLLLLYFWPSSLCEAMMLKLCLVFCFPTESVCAKEIAQQIGLKCAPVRSLGFRCSLMWFINTNKVWILYFISNRISRLYAVDQNGIFFALIQGVCVCWMRLTLEFTTWMIFAIWWTLKWVNLGNRFSQFIAVKSLYDCWICWFKFGILQIVV